ncbi:MAG: ATP-binding cassette domain-containing protein [Planctomycetales bacterium]|nr:ATP-binding cassette domain-containing protein [Planctomycetales bacterium]
MSVMVNVDSLSHRYGERQALSNLTLSVPDGEIFAVLGPNGGGKTTFFRLLSTLMPIQSGRIQVANLDVTAQTHLVRQRIGVVFQSPSLDKKLTVLENLRHQASLYGIRGQLLRHREAELMRSLGITDRANERTEKLSGGLRRRVELAKGLLHHPQLLILDEPSTGLDPGVRADLWNYLGKLRNEAGVTILFTTHLLEEAERADRIAIFHQGCLVANDSPENLRASVGGDSIQIECTEPQQLGECIAAQFGLQPQVIDSTIRLEVPNGHRLVSELMQQFGKRIHAIRLGKPSLEDVFISKTGHHFWE